MNAILYVAVVLIWGTTWIGITLQSHYVPPLAGIFWRFMPVSAFAALVMARPCDVFVTKSVRVQFEFCVFLYGSTIHPFRLGVGDFFDGGVF